MAESALNDPSASGSAQPSAAHGGWLMVLLELVAIVVISIVLVSAALGMLPGEADTTWLSRTWQLVQTAFTLHFADARWANPSAFAVIFRAAMISVTIIGATALVLIAIGVPLGVISVTRSKSRSVQLLIQGVSSISSLPVLVLGTLAYVILGRQFGITVREDTSLAWAIVAAIVTLSLGDRLLADIVHRVEIGTRAVLDEPYMRAVRAANLGFRRHLIQSLVPPVAEAVAARSMFLISGAIVAELVFSVHGLGFTVEHAVDSRETDLRLILASAMALIVIGLLFRIAHHAAIAFADPRRRR